VTEDKYGNNSCKQGEGAHFLFGEGCAGNGCAICLKIFLRSGVSSQEMKTEEALQNINSLDPDQSKSR
jgi:hypothetical protein